MMNFFREDLGRQLERLREAGRISGQTCRHWAQLAANGARDYVAARGLYTLKLTN